MKNLIFTIFLTTIFINLSLTQNNLQIHGGIKFIDYKGSNIQLYYRDESPDPDEFYTNIDLENKLLFNLGVNFNNYSKNTKLYYDLTLNGYIGNFLGIEAGASIGYPIFLSKNKKISFLPSIMGGGGWYDKPLGTLQNNTIYIQVNNTKFKDYSNVDLSLVGFYGFIRPSLSLLIGLNKKVNLVFTGSYLINFDINPSVKFTGNDDNNNKVSDSEEITASNIAFYTDGKSSNDSPFKLMGPEVRFGVNILLGNKGKSAK